MDGKIDMMTAAQEVALDFIGFMICFAIGLLFVFIFPIVALCFCCCRCCGNCGGKRLQKHDDNAKCKRYVFSAILFVLAMFVVAGAACTFVTSDQVSKNLGGLNDSFSDSVDDVQAFVDNIHSQFTRLGDTNFVFLSDVLKNYVGNASTEISERLITEINAIVNLDEPLDKISTLSDQAVVQIDDLEATTATAKGQRDSAVASLRPISAGCPVTNCIDPEITTLENLPFDDMETKLRNFRDKVTTDVFDSLKTELDGNIEAEVKKATDNIEVGTEMDKIYNDQIKPMLDQVDKLKTNMASDMDSYKDMVDSFTSLAEPYDKYRWYAGVGLASFLMLIAVLMLFGIVLGILCGSANAKPTERGAASNCGGIMLMAAVGLIFIFGAFLMLLTTLMYMLGSLTERYVCQTFDDLSKVEEDLNLLENLNMSQTVQEASATIDVSAAVNDLKATTAALGDLKTSTTQDLVNTLFDYVESYVGDVKTKNGFWLAIGWCIFFFMPGLIFAVKLAKHFRRMLYEDSYGSPTTCAMRYFQKDDLRE
nr:hypothetical protein BaRGS_008329 [Batillaria attramentaria]